MKTAAPALALAALFAAPAFAEAPGDPAAPLEQHLRRLDERVVVLDGKLAELDTRQADAWKRWADDFSRDMRASMGTMYGSRLGPARLVKNAPYSAEMITEANQPLADGNVISRRTTGAVYRDGEGRVRQETGGDGRERTIYINDPVAGKTFVLSPGSKKAVATSLPNARLHEHANTRVRSRNRQVVRVDDKEVRVEDGKVFVNGVETPESSINMTSKRGNVVKVENGRILVNGRELVAPPPPGVPGAPGDVAVATPNGHVVVRTVEAKDGDGVRREEVRVQVVRSEDLPVPPMPPAPPAPPMPPANGAMPLPPIPPMPPMPGIQTMRFESTARLGKGVTTQLGVKDFDGVKAEGKATTWTIAAGEIGNRNPIHVTSETWYSPDLQVTVYSRYNDPRTGETVFKLSGIKRGEPGADLFKVPEEYSVKDKSRK